ncbi:hypothetical protein MTO96_019384 [Rhipicephalus appendiculatus]
MGEVHRAVRREPSRRHHRGRSPKRARGERSNIDMEAEDKEALEAEEAEGLPLQPTTKGVGTATRMLATKHAPTILEIKKEERGQDSHTAAQDSRHTATESERLRNSHAGSLRSASLSRRKRLWVAVACVAVVAFVALAGLVAFLWSRHRSSEAGIVKIANKSGVPQIKDNHWFESPSPM